MAAVAAARCPIPGRHPFVRAVRGFFVCRGRCGRRSGRIVPVGRRSGRRTRDRYVGVRRKARPEKRRPHLCGRGTVFRGNRRWRFLHLRTKCGLWRLRSGMFVPIAGRGGNDGCRRAEDGVEDGSERAVRCGSSRRVAPGRITRRRRAPAVRAGSRRRRSRSGRRARPGCRVRRIRRRCPVGGRGAHGLGH